MFDNFLIHTFHDGNCLQAYKIFGAHFETHEGKKGVRFTTFTKKLALSFLFAKLFIK